MNTIAESHSVKTTYIFSHSLKALWKVVSYKWCQLHGRIENMYRKTKWVVLTHFGYLSFFHTLFHMSGRFH